MTAPAHDPEKWPLQPGLAPPEVEAALQESLANAPEPSAETRARIAQILRRADREHSDREKPTGT
ncbi:hypothetical protein [Gordonia sputi]